MVKVKKEGIILEPTNLDFENLAVLNPGCIKVGNEVHMFYRAVREGNYSSIGYCRLKGPLKVVKRAKRPILIPELNYEKHGIEDPRIVYLNGKYYLTYMAYDGKNVVAAYAISNDLKKWKKQKKITHLISYGELRSYLKGKKIAKRYACFEIYDKEPGDKEDEVYIWGKDVVLFPKKINGKFALLHRVLPDIHIIYFRNFNDLTLNYWKAHIKELPNYIVLKAKYWFETRQIGAGCPPIETDKGWLLIYHAVQKTKKGNIYRAGAALVDINNPCKVIARLNYPLFSPEHDWECKGLVNNVVFPSGYAIFKDTLYIYYGAADKRIAVASVNIHELVNELLTKGKTYI